ncbi:MAG: inositol monophosphatase family protein [Patescibacteria group bacterium]
MDIRSHFELIVKAAQAGGNQGLAKQERTPTIYDVGGGSLTTAEDEPVQATVIRVLREGDPHTNIIGEESPEKRMTPQAYIIDPIDGTVGYSKNGEEWCTTIAYKNGDRIDAAVIYQPRTGTLITAYRGGKLEIVTRGVQQPIPPPQTGDITPWKLVAIAPLSSEFSDEIVQDVFAKLLQNMRFTEHGSSNSDGIKRFLLGHVDIFSGWGWIWDFAAGMLFVEMMGGAMATFHGESIDASVIGPQRVVFGRNKALLDIGVSFTRNWRIDIERRPPR